MQYSVFLVTLVLMAIVASAFAYVAFNASSDGEDYALVQAKAYGFRRKFFIALLVSGFIITAITTLDLPYAATRGEMADVDRTVDVAGYQWYWQLSDQEARVGETVAFKVSAGDVNHGLGLYDPDNVMVGQVQAMPGYENVLKMTLNKPGTYKLMCMEYCGLAHHAMVSDFTVTSR